MEVHRDSLKQQHEGYFVFVDGEVVKGVFEKTSTTQRLDAQTEVRQEVWAVVGSQTETQQPISQELFELLASPDNSLTIDDLVHSDGAIAVRDTGLDAVVQVDPDSTALS